MAGHAAPGRPRPRRLRGPAGDLGALAATVDLGTDPWVDGASFAWQRIDGSGWLRTRAGERPLAGTVPAVGGGRVAWLGRGVIHVSAGGAGRARRISVPAGATVDGLAVSGSWLVVRDVTPTGIATLFAVSLVDPHDRRHIAASATLGAIGRPTIEGAVAYSVSGPAQSRIEEIDLASGARTLLRSASANVAFSNPSLHGGLLLDERTDRCAQLLLLGAPASAAHDRTLLELPSTVLRDPGWQPGYQQAWNSASLCSNRATGAGGRLMLGATALGSADAYVTESPTSDVGASVIEKIALAVSSR